MSPPRSATARNWRVTRIATSLSVEVGTGDASIHCATMNEEASEVEHCIGSPVQTDKRAHATDREQRAAYIWDRTAAGVMPDRQRLIGHPEDDLRTNHEAGKANGMDLRSAQGRASGFAGTNGIVNRNGCDGMAHSLEARYELTRCAARRIDLVIVSVVPTTTCAPRSSAATMFALALSGFVNSTNTSQSTASASAADA